MDTLNKLNEARYFLDRLIEFEEELDPELAFFNLSAFLSAWRSVLDVMLYDFAEYYEIGLDREDDIKPFAFKLASKILKHEKASEFIQWFNKKIGELSNNPLWKERNFIVHRGYPRISYRIYSISTTGGIIYDFGDPFTPLNEIWEQDSYEAEFPDVLDACEEGFEEMKKIVEEAEEKFGIDFSDERI